MAAHVERIKHEREVVELADNQTDFNRSVSRLCGTIDESPKTSLAQVKAKALNDFVSDVMDMEHILHLSTEVCCHHVLMLANSREDKIRKESDKDGE